MNGRNDTRDIEDDGFITIDMKEFERRFDRVFGICPKDPLPAPLEPDRLAASGEGGAGLSDK